MPKIVAVDAKTGQPQGEVISGRSVKVHTQQTPQPLDITQHNAAKVAQNQSTPTEGQANSNAGSNQAATPLDPKFEALARKETAFRQREREFQAREAAYKEKEAKLATIEAREARLKQSPLDVLNELGITYDQLVEQALNQPDPNTKAINAKLQSIEDNQRKLAEDAQNSVKAQRESAIKQIRFDVTDLIDTDPQFETIKATDSVDDVVSLIEKTFDESGKLLTVEQASKLVEEELLEEAIKIANISKVRAKLAPKDAVDPLLQAKQQTGQQQQITTLTNQMTSTRPLTARERAIKRFKGEAF